MKAGFPPPDHPLFLLLTEPRRMAYRAIEALWCRLVDAGGALSARTYRDGEPVGSTWATNSARGTKVAGR